MLRKHDSKNIKENLKSMIKLIQNAKSDIILVGVPKPGLILKVPGYYKELAKEYGIRIDTKTLKTVLSNSSLKSDYIHPNAKGHEFLADSFHSLITK